MNNKFFTWGDGKKSETYNKDFDTSRNIQLIPELSSDPVEDIYMKDNCTLYLSRGELYKEGKFNFELTQNKKKTLINFHWKTSKESIVHVSFGENHVLVLTKQGNVYSWGDNYYGQLGLDKNMLPWSMEPEYVKISNVRFIFAHKNNSFAIDNDNQLWVWGKKDFLGGKIIFHQFKPIHILKNFLIKKLKIFDDKVVVVGKDPDVIIEKEIEENLEEKFKKKEEKLKNNINTISNQFQQKKNELEPENIISYISKTNDILKNLISKLSAEDNKLVDIRKNILNGPTLMNFAEQIKEIEYLNLKNIKKSKNSLNMEKLTYYESVDLISIILKSIIAGKFEISCLENISKNLPLEDKEVNLLLSKFELISSDNTSIFSSLTKNTQSLSNYFLKYKKIEYLIYKMSFHQHMLKEFTFDNVLSAMTSLFEDHEGVEKKLYLLEKSFDCLNFLLEKTDSSLKNISVVYSKLHKFNIIDDNSTDADKFIYKYIIESTIYIRDLWKLLIENVREHRKAKEKEIAIEKVFENFKELHSIQMYLNSIALGKSIKKNFTKDHSSIKESEQRNLEENLKQIDGAIKRLNVLVDKYMDREYDHFSQVFYNCYIINLGIMYFLCLFFA